MRYVGVDLSAPMVEAARRRLAGRAEIHEADLNDYAPAGPVQATTCFRAIYYAHDRRAFFERVAGYTETKLVFDLNPRQYRVDEVRADLAAAGLARIELPSVLQPAAGRPPGPVAAGCARPSALRSLPASRSAYRFSYMVAASRSAAPS